MSDEDVIGGPLVLRHASKRSSGTWERKIMPDEQRPYVAACSGAGSPNLHTRFGVRLHPVRKN